MGERGARRMCERGHVQHGPHSGRCVVKVGEPGKRYRECGLPVSAEPALLRCGCGRGLFVGGWCSSCGARQPGASAARPVDASESACEAEIVVTCSCCGSGMSDRNANTRFCSGRCRMRSLRGRCEAEMVR